jgi:hypothetical protein
VRPAGSPSQIFKIDFGNPYRSSQTHTMCSPTHNAAATMIDCPPVDPPPRGPATQVHRAAFSKRLPACSATAARVMEKPGLPPSNRDKDRTRSTYSAMFSKMYVVFSSVLPSPANGTRGRTATFLTFLLPFHSSFYGRKLSGISRCGRG